MKTVLIFTLFGALLGIVAASLVVPPALGWYNEAGYLTQSQAGQPGPQALVNVPQLIHYATSRLIRGQLIGGVVGAVAFFVIGILVARRSRRPVAAAVPVAPPAPRPPA